MNKKIAVAGIGYVGLSLAVLLAQHNEIMAVDILLPGCDPIRLSLVQFSTTTVLSLIFALIFDPAINFGAILDVMPELLFLGIGSSGIAYTCQIVGQKHSDPAVASIILSLESVFGAIFSAIVLHERMQVREYIGSGIVLIAVIISQLDFKDIYVKIKLLITKDTQKKYDN